MTEDDILNLLKEKKKKAMCEKELCVFLSHPLEE
jgi:hypothetical protein